jgi:hypothetical protein
MENLVINDDSCDLSRICGVDTFPDWLHVTYTLMPPRDLASLSARLTINNSLIMTKCDQWDGLFPDDCVCDRICTKVLGCSPEGWRQQPTVWAIDELSARMERMEKDLDAARRAVPIQESDLAHVRRLVSKLQGDGLTSPETWKNNKNTEV